MAIEYVGDGHTLWEAAEVFYVPRSTLSDRLHKTVSPAIGRKPILSDDDENDLCNYVKYMANVGTPISPEWLRNTAGRIARER